MVTIAKRSRPDARTQALSLAGKIDERLDAAMLLGELAGTAKVLLDLARISTVTSSGIQAFCRLVEGLVRGGASEIVLLRVASPIAFQVAICPGIFDPARVESAQLPFVCGTCGEERDHVVPYVAGADRSHPPACACGATMELDGMAAQYLPT